MAEDVYLATKHERDYQLAEAALRSVRTRGMQALFRDFLRDLRKHPAFTLSAKQRAVCLKCLSPEEQANYEEKIVHPIDRLALPLRPPGRA